MVISDRYQQFMYGISADTVIQTTWRVPFAVNGSQTFRISFQSTQGTWVSFTIDGQSGKLSCFEGFAPANQIPNWYSHLPFAQWSIAVDSHHFVRLNGSTIIEYTWNSRELSLERFLKTFSPQAVCALWLGKFGYRILHP